MRHSKNRYNRARYYEPERGGQKQQYGGGHWIKVLPMAKTWAYLLPLPDCGDQCYVAKDCGDGVLKYIWRGALTRNQQMTVA